MASIHPTLSSDPNTAPTPAVFTPLPANHYLPFIVRSSEVHHLLTQGPPRRLWALIKQIYPTNLQQESDDPTKWPFSQLERWMFKVDRHEASDKIWVAKARACISRRSEPLWEKLKNALGVPPELELSDDEESGDEELEAVSHSMSGLNVSGKPSDADSNALGIAGAQEGIEGQDKEDEVDEYGEMGPTGLVLEAIYPAAAAANHSPDALKSSPSKNAELVGGMEIIGEEEEDEDKAPAGNIKLKTEDLNQADEAAASAEKTTELDPTRMVGITFVSHSRHIPLHEFVDREVESDGEAVIDSPLFPRSFATLPSPTALSRYVQIFALYPRY
jgi:hypothetical protein